MPQSCVRPMHYLKHGILLDDEYKTDTTIGFNDFDVIVDDQLTIRRLPAIHLFAGT